MADRHVRITVTIIDDESRTVTFDTADQKVRIDGDLFPRDLLLASELIQTVKHEQKHGPQQAG